MILPIASLVIGIVTLAALCFQVSLWLRYSFGTRRLRKWGDWLLALGDLELRPALTSAANCKGWLKAVIQTSMAALGITTGGFRVEHALGVIEEREERLFRHVFSRFCLGAMMVFGLAGTFLSFVQLISTSGLTDALKAISNGEDVSSQYPRLSTSFLQIYDGFGQAFISSLAGLISTLLLSFMDQVFVISARTRFLHHWVYLAHELERRLFADPKCAIPDPAVDEIDSDGRSSYAPPVVPATPLSDDGATIQKWEVLVKSLEDSHVFFDHCLNTLSATAQANREEMQKLVAEVVVAMREVVADVGKQVIKVSEAKADHLKKVDDSIQEHFAKRERMWQAKLQETLDAFKLALQESAQLSQSSLDNTRKDALEAGERVAKAVQKEAQAALGVVSDNQKSVVQAQLETLQTVRGLAELVDRIANVVAENKQSVESYISELTLSLKPWKNAPKSIDEALKRTNESQDILADVIKKMSSALEKTAQMPNRWETEIKGLSGLISEVAERRRSDRIWYQFQAWAKEFMVGMKTWFKAKK